MFFLRNTYFQNLFHITWSTQARVFKIAFPLQLKSANKKLLLIWDKNGLYVTKLQYLIYFSLKLSIVIQTASAYAITVNLKYAINFEGLFL